MPDGSRGHAERVSRDPSCDASGPVRVSMYLRPATPAKRREQPGLGPATAWILSSGAAPGGSISTGSRNDFPCRRIMVAAARENICALSPGLWGVAGPGHRRTAPGPRCGPEAVRLRARGHAKRVGRGLKSTASGPRRASWDWFAHPRRNAGCNLAMGRRLRGSWPWKRRWQRLAAHSPHGRIDSSMRWMPASPGAPLSRSSRWSMALPTKNPPKQEGRRPIVCSLRSRIPFRETTLPGRQVGLGVDPVSM